MWISITKIAISTYRLNKMPNSFCNYILLMTVSISDNYLLSLKYSDERGRWLIKTKIKCKLIISTYHFFFSVFCFSCCHYTYLTLSIRSRIQTFYSLSNMLKKLIMLCLLIYHKYMYIAFVHVVCIWVEKLKNLFSFPIRKPVQRQLSTHSTPFIKLFLLSYSVADTIFHQQLICKSLVRNQLEFMNLLPLEKVLMHFVVKC